MSHGKVSELLATRIKKQVAERGIVIMYDPAKSYANLFQTFELPETHILRYEGSFFRIREKLESLLDCVASSGKLKRDADVPPQCVVYIPLSREASEFALIEAETAGIVIEPNSSKPELNTRLGSLVVRVFGSLAPAKASHLADQAEDGLLTLEDLDRMADDAGTPVAGALQVIFDKSSTEDILLRFLSSNQFDAAIDEKKAHGELAALTAEQVGLAEDAKNPSALREALARHLVLSELVLAIPEGDRPDALNRYPLPDEPDQREQIRRLCELWRNRVDLKQAYVSVAEEVESHLSSALAKIPLAGMETSEILPSIDRCWLNLAARKITERDSAVAREIALRRGRLFWSRELPNLQIEWKVIEAAAALCLEADRVRAALKAKKWSFDALITAYASGDEPWMRLDRIARRMEARLARLEFTDEEAQLLDKAIAVARTRYSSLVHDLAQAYLDAAAEAEFTSSTHNHQSRVYREKVAPVLSMGETVAYFLVDALRLEMAVELVRGLGTEFEVQLEPVLGQLPGITPVGMAALMPEAETGLALSRSGGLAVSIRETTVTTRTSRLSWLRDKAGVPVAVFKLGEAAKLSPKRKKEVAEARLVVVTSQEIDRLGEEGSSEEETRIYLDDVLDKIRRAVRSLARAGVRTFIITADHGFQLLDTYDPGLGMDAPGGSTVDLHARAWIGQGGTAGDGFIRVKASDLELGGPLELAFPKGLGTFKVKGGAGIYFHGGISPQEHILPAITLKVASATRSAAGSRVKLTYAKAAVTNRLFTVTVEYQLENLLSDAERRVRVELLSGKDEVGFAAAAVYGLEEGAREIVLRVNEPNAVTLMIEPSVTPDEVTIQVVDCETMMVLESLKNLPVKLGL